MFQKNALFSAAGECGSRILPPDRFDFVFVNHKPAESLEANRDRGDSRLSSPPTPPYMRVRIRRFGGLS
jgi:hypothetical protein